MNKSKQIRVGKYMVAEPLGCNPEVWTIVSEDGNDVLGYVEWEAKHRNHVFNPESNAVFSACCCDALAKFMQFRDAEMKERKAER